VGVNVVAAYAQNLGILLLKPAIILPEGGGLTGSTRGKVEYVEGEHHILAPPVAAEANIAVADRRKGKIWGYLTDFCCHVPPFRTRF
jgi:hypothetical protein